MDNSHQTDTEELALRRSEEQKRLATLTGTEREEYAAEIARGREIRKQIFE